MEGIRKMRKGMMLQVLLLLLLACVCSGGFLLARRILQFPFRSTNDVLHRKGSSLNLDFLITEGVYLDEKMTIGEVIRIRLRKETRLHERALKTVSDLIPVKYRYLADLLLFLFWSLVFMTFLRVFTFMGYGRALRSSLLLGGCTYYFMPDFSPGRTEDIFFVGFPLFIIIFRIFLVRRKKRKKVLLS